MNPHFATPSYYLPEVCVCQCCCEKAEASVTDKLGHVAFMAWLDEVRDAADYSIVRDLIWGESHFIKSTYGMSVEYWGPVLDSI